MDASDSVHILVITQAQTTGLELQRASLLVMWDIPTSPSLQYQTFGRVAHRGQVTNPLIYLISVRGLYSDKALKWQKTKAAVTLRRWYTYVDVIRGCTSNRHIDDHDAIPSILVNIGCPVWMDAGDVCLVNSRDHHHWVEVADGL